MSHRQIVVDDSDSLFHYVGSGWFQDVGNQDNLGNFGPPFLHTLHGTNLNDSFSFSFEGSSIQIIGTTNRVNTTTGFDPSWECFVDEISIGATQPFQYAENNWELCGQPQLVDGHHVVTVNVTQATTTGRTFWFDDITYTPSSNVSTNGAYVLVQNNDPGVVYGAGWGALGTTANFTTQTGADLKFNFTGTGLSWFGFIPVEFSHNASSATYAIDGGNPVTFRLNGLSPTVTTTVYNQVFFSISNLPAGPHMLDVVHGGNGQQTPLTLDYLVVTSTSTNPTTSPVANTSIPYSTPQTSSSHQTPIGAIVGGVVGGVVLLVLAVALFLWARRRKRGIELQESSTPRARESSIVLTSYPPSTMLNPSTASRISLLAPPALSQTTYTTYNVSTARPTSTTMTTSLGSGSRSAEPLHKAIRRQEQTLVHLEYTQPEPAVHADSGQRFRPGEDVTETPPQYTED